MGFQPNNSKVAPSPPSFPSPYFSSSFLPRPLSTPTPARMRHQDEEHFVTLRDNLNGTTSLMDHQVRRILDDCTCNSQDGNGIFQEKTRQTVTHIDTFPRGDLNFGDLSSELLVSLQKLQAAFCQRMVTDDSVTLKHLFLSALKLITITFSALFSWTAPCVLASAFLAEGSALPVTIATVYLHHLVIRRILEAVALHTRRVPRESLSARVHGAFHSRSTSAGHRCESTR